jgi:hypothetical protein
MTNQNVPLQREILPIPDRKPLGLTTYDAKAPATTIPPIVPLRPPAGAPKEVGFNAANWTGAIASIASVVLILVLLIPT